ncbi:CUB domain-containing protein 2-like isoform X2 [Clavelina lepadiformis]|uniref:CUB domain-containing protein 2-like isoform X2 n=1 Tax=Clavelina lepadiformis TaxID=159417 RepID=UPI0040426CEB
MVASPSYLSTTEHNFSCTFFFHARPGYRVELDMEVDIESCCDYIDIYDEEGFIRKLTGMIPHTDVLSIGQVLKLVYNSNRASSNHKVASKGFLARYRQFSCGGHYEINNGTTGVVTSPNYPNNTMYNFQCTYTFHAQPGHGVKLSLLVDTEACCAKIEIFDGKVLRKILEGKDQKNVMSEEQSMKLVYISDYTDTDSKIASKGFWAKYEQYQLTQ